jgi:hypothetical protein
VNGDVGHAELQRLKIRINGHELDPGNPSLNHPIHSIDTTATNAHNPNYRLMRLPTPRRLVLRLLPPIPRSFDNRLHFAPPVLLRLLRENALQPLRRRLLRAF